ncbi:MAG: DUF4443 domain-containing protein [Conexivisphaerales archaeon]
MSQSILLQRKSEGLKLWFEVLKQIAYAEAKGPSPSFDIADIILAMITIDNTFIGRKRLALALGLGEGAIRTLISRLKESGLLETLASGCRLTSRGLQLNKEISSDISFFDPPSIIPTSLHLSGLVAKKLGRQVGKGLEERDAAVRAGADGAMILVVNEGRIIMPGVSDLSVEHPDHYRALMQTAKPEEEDLLVIAWAKEQKIAKKAALAVVTWLLERSSRL